MTVSVAAPVANGTRRIDMPAPSALLISSKVEVSLWSSAVAVGPPLLNRGLPPGVASSLLVVDDGPKNDSARNQIDVAQPSDLNGQTGPPEGGTIVMSSNVGCTAREIPVPRLNTKKFAGPEDLSPKGFDDRWLVKPPSAESFSARRRTRRDGSESG